MSKKLHPLAVAFRAADALSDDEKLALRDYLRPAPKPRQKVKSKPAQKRKAGKEAKGGDVLLLCKKCSCELDDNIHQLPAWENYHEFVEPAGEAKGASV